MGKSRIGDRMKALRADIAAAEMALAILHARHGELLATVGSRKPAKRRAKPEAAPQAVAS